MLPACGQKRRRDLAVGRIWTNQAALSQPTHEGFVRRIKVLWSNRRVRGPGKAVLNDESTELRGSDRHEFRFLAGASLARETEMPRTGMNTGIVFHGLSRDRIRAVRPRPEAFNGIMAVCEQTRLSVHE
jgi:hypothetical protein